MPRLRTRRIATASAIAAIATATWLSTTHAAVCAKTGEPAPAVVTLMASNSNPATDAWIVSPNCDVTTMQVPSNNALEVSDLGIERISSVPTSILGFFTDNNPISQGADFSSAKELSYLLVQHFSPAFVENLILPTAKTTKSIAVIFENSKIKSIDKIQFPNRPLSIGLSDTEVSTFKRLPDELSSLVLVSNTMTSLDFRLPTYLTILDVRRSTISKLERITFPSFIKSLACEECSLTTVRGVKWPKALTILKLSDNRIALFEIRESDAAIFKNLATFEATITQNKCSDSTAKLTTIKSHNLCVISDDRFETLYGPASSVGTNSGSKDATAGTTTKTSKSSGSSSSSGATGSRSGSSSNSGGQEEGSTRGSSNNDIVASSGENTTTSSSSGSPTRGNHGSQAGLDPTTADSTAAASPKNVVVIILAAIGCILALLLAIIVYRLVVISKHKKKTLQTPSQSTINTPSKYIQSNTPSTVDNKSNNKDSSMPSSSQEYLANDIRNDMSLLPFRIDQSQLQIGRQIARGGFGVVFQASYQGRSVAIKQMLPNAWKDESHLSSFMDEIRMCSSLDHPKIVSFVGISWSSLRDVCVVIEFMDGGDLHTVLHKTRQQQASSPRDWQESWTEQGIKCKTGIAEDISEAVVYLHSFQNPILHRDLKAKNVLLDNSGNAKLSDFGISREMSVDETMTSEIGTAAWIAPEVLRGERYSEKADIYSLGVLLVELDSCRHPYADTSLLQAGVNSTTGRGAGVRGGTRSQVAHKNTQIAVLVSTGKLKPATSAQCPANVKLLVERCLEYAPEDRPTAMEVFYALRNVRKAFEAVH